MKNNFPDNSANIIFDKIQPQAIEVEEAILGAILNDLNALAAVVDLLKPQSFYKPSHSKIFEIMIDMFNRSMSIELLTVIEELRKKNYIELVGGIQYILYLSNKASSSMHVVSHAKIVAEAFIKREIIRISTTSIQDSFNNATDVFDLLSKAEQSFYEITSNNLNSNIERLDSIIRKANKELEAICENPDKTTGVPSGFQNLDRVTHGWHPGNLIILAARPGMGKTSYALALARNAAVEFNKTVAFFSLEMSKTELANRIVSMEAEVESSKIRSGKLNDFDWQKINQASSYIADAPLYIDDNSTLTLFDLRAKCRRLYQYANLSLVIIDYIQLMKFSDGERKFNREQEISAISRGLKAISKELKIPVIALAQLSRDAEKSKRPMLSHLRESGAIEQDADLVMFLFRPEYYESDDSKPQGFTELIIAKNRHGSTEPVNLRFNEKYTKFSSITEDHELLSKISDSNIMIKNTKVDTNSIIPF